MKIKVKNKTYDLGDEYQALIHYNEYQRGNSRDLVKIDFNGMTEDEVKNIGFTDGITWSIIVKNENNEDTEFDMSTYSLVGNMVITYEGVVSLYMGKQTDTELLESMINDLLEA